MGALSGGSRYDSEVVQNAAAVIESQMNKMRQEGYRGISEHMASRGLTGSSVEGREIGDYESDIQRYGQERLSNLEREQALAYSQDRNAAISQALGLEGMESNERMQQMALQLQREGMSADQAYRQASLALQREGMGADQAYRMAGLDLQKQGMAFDQEYRNRSLDMQGERWASDDAFRNASLDWQREMGLAGLDMDRERLDMSRDQMEADNGFRQRSLDLQEQGMSQDEAYRQAEQEFRQSSWQQEFDFDQERWGDQEEVARLNMLLQAYDAFGSNALAFLNGGGEGGMDPSTLDENWVAREDWEGKSGPHAAAAYRKWLEQEEIRKAMGGN